MSTATAKNPDSTALQRAWMGTLQCGACAFRWLAMLAARPTLVDCPNCKETASAAPDEFET